YRRNLPVELANLCPAVNLLAPLADVPDAAQWMHNDVVDEGRDIGKRLSRCLTDALGAPDPTGVQAVPGSMAELGDRVRHDLGPIPPELLGRHDLFSGTKQDRLRDKAFEIGVIRGARSLRQTHHELTEVLLSA